MTPPVAEIGTETPPPARLPDSPGRTPGARPDDAWSTPPADLRARTVRGGAVTIATQALCQGLQLAALMVLARLLGPREFGLAAMVTVVTSFVTTFAIMGLSLVTVQRPRIDQRQLSTLFWINVAASVVVTGLLALAAPVVARLNGEPMLTVLMPVLALETLFTGLAAQHSALLQRRMAFGRLGAAQVVGLAVGVGVSVAAAVNGAGVWALALLPVTRSAVALVMVLALGPWMPGRPHWDAALADMLRFGRNLVGLDVINQLAARFDSFMVGVACGAVLLGAYTRAYQLLLLPLAKVNLPLSRVGIAALSRLHSDPQRYRRAFFQMLNRLMLVTAPTVALLIVTADWAVQVVLGAGWEQAARLFVLLGPAALIMPLLNPIGWLFVSQNRTGDSLRWAVISSTIRIMCLLVGLRGGVAGVAAAVSASYLVIAPLGLWFVCRRGPLGLRDFVPTLRLTAATAGSVLAVLSLYRWWLGPAAPGVGLLGAGALTGAIAAGFWWTTRRGGAWALPTRAMAMTTEEA